MEVTGQQEVIDALQRLKATTGANVRRALSRCGLIAVREAKANAPRSPTNKQVSAGLKRKRRTSRRTYPGGLEKSIAYETDASQCSVFVAANAPAAKYAKRIHDEKGRTWHNRGPGTVAKGPRADDKFIERAIRDNSSQFTAIFNNEIQKAHL